MAFSEKLKLQVKRKAHFTCCICHTIGVEIHHIIPESEGGPSTEENAAPLCPRCHDLYGDNPKKRKFIREIRDFWYMECEKRYAPTDTSLLEQILGLLQQNASRYNELKEALDVVIELLTQ